MMELKKDIQDCCSICFKELNSFEATKATEVIELFNSFIARINFKLLEDSLICGACLVKIQSACNLKTSYVENSHKTLVNIKKENETDLEKRMEKVQTDTEKCIEETSSEMCTEIVTVSEKCFVCEICKNIINTRDCILLFDSITEIDKLNLMKYFLKDLETKMNENPQTCEQCYKSLLNFCVVINSLSVFDEDKICDSVVTSESESCCISIKKEFPQLETDLNSVNINQDFKNDIKEGSPLLLEVKEEKEDRPEYEEFLGKNEEIDLKMDCDGNAEAEQIWKESEQEAGNCDWIEINTLNSSINSTDSTLKNFKTLNIFFCQICQYKTKYKSTFDRHILTHQSSDEIEMFQCRTCPFQTKHKKSITRHMLVHKSPEERETLQSKSSNSKKFKIFSCHFCGFETNRQGTLNRHILTHQSSDEIEMFRCEMCPFQTKHKNSITRHMLIHNSSEEMKTLQCELCEFRTKHKYSLQLHVLLHKNPNEIQVFECKICSYKTKFKHYLRRHTLIHDNAEGIEMSSLSSLDDQTKHENNLTKMFQCETCDYQTKFKHYLKRHVLIHKKLEDAETFACSNCEYRTNVKASLHRHMLIHKSSGEIEMFRCQFCEFQTKHKQNLKCHLLTHKSLSETKLFRCQTCKFQTKYKCSLNKHLKSHRP